MRILLIGNFAPPYEEENLHNLSLLKKLEDNGHQCTVINISNQSATDKRFMNSPDLFGFLSKLARHGFRKHVIHILTKGYLRLGLLKLMFAILAGFFFRAKTFITIHSELFSVQGQMRSPVGGRQTLFTAFTMANRIICADKDTYDTASMYMKKSNFDLIPSFAYIPDEILKNHSSSLDKLREKEKVIIFSNIKYPSLIFEIIKDILSRRVLPPEVGIVISISETPGSKLQHVFEETGKDIIDRLIFISRDDLKSTILAYSKANIIIRPMSCDGITFLESFAISVKKLMRVDNHVYYPNGLLLLKEGDISSISGCLINMIQCMESAPIPESMHIDSYERILRLYEGK